MGLPTVKRFCFCCDLETGGTIIGWFTAVLSFFLMIGSIGMVVVASMALLGSIVYTHLSFFESLAWVIIGSIYVLYFFIYLIAGIGLIMAVKHRDPFRMKLFLFLMVIGIVLAFLSIIINMFAGIGSALLYAIIYSYYFICIYSLYKKLLEERMGNNPNVNLQPIQPF